MELDTDKDKIITRDEMLQYLHKLEALKHKEKGEAIDPEQTLKEVEKVIEDIFGNGELRSFLLLSINN